MMLATIKIGKSLVDYCRSYADFCSFVVKLKEVSKELKRQFDEDVLLLVEFNGVLGDVCKAELIFENNAKDLVFGDDFKSDFHLLRKAVEFFDSTTADRFCLVPLKCYKRLHRFHVGAFKLKIFGSSISVKPYLVFMEDDGGNADLPIVGYKDFALVIDGNWLFIEEPALADVAMYWLMSEY